MICASERNEPSSISPLDDGPFERVIGLVRSASGAALRRFRRRPAYDAAWKRVCDCRSLTKYTISIYWVRVDHPDRGVSAGNLLVQIRSLSHYEDFVVRLGDEIVRQHRQLRTEIAGALEVLDARAGIRLLPTYSARAHHLRGHGCGHRLQTASCGEFAAAVGGGTDSRWRLPLAAWGYGSAG